MRHLRFLWFHILSRLSFHVGGIVVALWPLSIAAWEIKECYPAWESMCGTAIVIMDPVGAYPIIPLIRVWERLIPGIMAQNTLGYLLFALHVVLLHYLVGGLLGVWVTGWKRRLA